MTVKTSPLYQLKTLSSR